MALPNGIKSTQELLDAQAHIWNHIFNLINSMSLKCAVQLRIPDIIHKHSKPMTLSQLMSALPINKSKSPHIERLMRILVNSRLFTSEEEGYSLTPISLLLLQDEPLNMAPFLLSMLDRTLIDPWHHLSEWFKTDFPTPFMKVYGRTFWERAELDEEMNRLFNEGMASDARLVKSVIVKDCREIFQGLKSMVDVGGGTGTVAKAIAEGFPGLKCSVLELPHVIIGLEGTENLSFVGGDMFESIPHANAIFMKWILHDWPDEECVKILKNCKQAIIPNKNDGGKLILIDMVVDDKNDDHKALETQLFFDMLMMNLASGRERTEKDWAKLFHDAGFTSYKINRVFGLRSLIEVFP